jgi:hypothetical protein
MSPGSQWSHPPTPRLPRATLQSGFAQSELTIEQLWLRYIGVGGSHTPAYLTAALTRNDLPDREHNLIVQALNEHFVDQGGDHPVAYGYDVDIRDQQD